MSISDKLAIISENIQKVYDAGFAAGAATGGGAGGDSTASYDEFWDACQSRAYPTNTPGDRINYQYAFAYNSWNDTTFKPKHDIVPTSCGYMFYYSQITDLKAILERQNVILDLSKVSSTYYMFRYSKITNIGDLNISKATTTDQMFQNCSNLVSVGTVTFTGGAFANAFLGCTSLVNISFNGKFTADTNFKDSPLSVESAKNIISCLDSSVSGKKLTLKSTSWTALESSEYAPPAETTWVDYVKSIGWTAANESGTL